MPVRLVTVTSLLPAIVPALAVDSAASRRAGSCQQSWEGTARRPLRARARRRAGRTDRTQGRAPGDRRLADQRIAVLVESLRCELLGRPALTAAVAGLTTIEVAVWCVDT